MRERVNPSELRKKYNVWGIISERLGIYLSRRFNRPPIFLSRDSADRTLKFAFLWLKIIFIPYKSWKAYNEAEQLIGGYDGYRN